MTILSFKSKKDKLHLYEKAKKMEEYASMIVDCLEDAGYSESDYDEEENYRRMYRHGEDGIHDSYRDSRYAYRRMK